MAKNLPESKDNYLVTIDKSFFQFARNRVISNCRGKLIRSGAYHYAPKIGPDRAPVNKNARKNNRSFIGYTINHGKNLRK